MAVSISSLYIYDNAVSDQTYSFHSTCAAAPAEAKYYANRRAPAIHANPRSDARNQLGTEHFLTQ